MKIHRLDHIHVYCLDPDASRRFYTDVLEAQGCGHSWIQPYAILRIAVGRVPGSAI
jgi:catechol 2,3-dioxygenase-like lactoylglutathione lyase family enzyme